VARNRPGGTAVFGSGLQAPAFADALGARRQRARMAKVSLGLRGWRFDEEDVFTEDGEFREPAEMEEDVRDRVIRVADLVGSPCDACYLIHGDEHVEECDVVEVVYGELHSEVVLCSEHETDLVYWYQEGGGREYRGTAEFQDAFYDWFEAGNRAPEAFEGVEHVDTDPLSVPTPETPSAEERAEQWEVTDRLELRDGDVDLDQDYPTG